MIDKLAICKQTRKVSSDSLLRTLTKALGTNDPISESQFRDFWLSELRTHKELFPDGWYTPPPHGIGVLFGNQMAFRSPLVFIVQVPIIYIMSLLGRAALCSRGGRFFLHPGGNARLSLAKY